MPKRSPRILDLANEGAEARLRELAQEVRVLLRLFPHQRDSFDDDELPVNFILAAGAGGGAKEPPRRTRRMSAAARKAISERMTRYWARRRAEKE